MTKQRLKEEKICHIDGELLQKVNVGINDKSGTAYIGCEWYSESFLLFFPDVTATPRKKSSRKIKTKKYSEIMEINVEEY